MLSSIHPLGERARNNRWAVTVGSFLVAAVVAGGALGVALGFLGGVLFGSQASSTLVVATGAVAMAAGLLDLIGPAPGPRRQVNENWIGQFRGWVYGGAFGAQLGTGFVTYVVTWLVYATLVAELLTTSAWAGALVGGVFGLGRSLALLATAWVDRPSRLTSFHRVMGRIGPATRLATAQLAVAVGLLATVGGLV
jgi:sulfite exporter TauE/SafE